MKFFSLIFIILISCSAYANKSSSQWEPPKNIIELCKNLESSIINTYKIEIEANRSSINSQLTISEKNDAFAISDAAKKFLRVNEESWFKLSCSNLLYKK